MTDNDGIHREIPPDLLIRVRSREGPALVFELNATDSRLALTYKSFGPHRLQRDPETFFNAFFRDLEDQAKAMKEIGTSAEAQVLEDKGLNLFEEIFPESLQELLWRIHPEIRSLCILTDEPWIPWELCKLQGGAGSVQTGPFFCEAFDMTRWFAGSTSSPSLPLRRIAVVGRQGAKLPKVRDEIRFLLGLGEDGTRRVHNIEATWPALRRAMRSGRYDGWHFAGHGKLEEDGPVSVLKLDDGHVLTPENITGMTRNLGATHPLVFLNSCYSGRGGLSLTGLSGWARKLIKNGAGAFVGAQWAVPDEAALQFAEAFYRHLFSGCSLGRAVNLARMEIRPRGDASYLAFTVFGDPLARVGLEAPPLRKAAPSQTNPGADRMAEFEKTGLLEYLAAHEVSEDQWQEILRKKTGDDKGFGEMLLADLNDGLFRKTSPNELPDQVHAYYEARWRALRQRDETAWVGAHVPVLSVLAVIREPIDAAMLARFSGVSEPNLTPVIRAWSRFLQKEPLEGGEARYFLSDPEFRNFIQAKAQNPDEGLNLKKTQLRITTCLYEALFSKG